MTTWDAEGREVAEIEIWRPQIITIIGAKGSGKSVLAAAYCAQYPFDRVVIDPTSDALVGPAFRELPSTDLPGRFPVHPEGQQVSIVVRPDVGSPTYADDIDRAVGLSYHHPKRRSLLWVDERDEVTSGAKTEPNMKRSLYSGRHVGQTLITCGPRALGMDPKFLLQSDVVIICSSSEGGALKSEYDRSHLAKVKGIPRDELDELLDQLGPYEYVRITNTPDEAVVFPPLDEHIVRQLERGQFGYQVPPKDRGPGVPAAS